MVRESIFPFAEHFVVPQAPGARLTVRDEGFRAMMLVAHRGDNRACRVNEPGNAPHDRHVDARDELLAAEVELELTCQGFRWLRVSAQRLNPFGLVQPLEVPPLARTARPTEQHDPFRSKPEIHRVEELLLVDEVAIKANPCNSGQRPEFGEAASANRVEATPYADGSRLGHKRF